jgi:2'-5' RNA ligase
LKARLFAALELPPPVTQQLADLMTRLRESLPPRAVRWVRPEGIHLTLQFYGEVDGELVPRLEAALARAAAGSRPIAARLDALGVFPGPLRPQVLWVGLAGDLEALTALQAAVEAESQGVGFKPEAREFRAHLTLGRVSRNLRPADHKRLADDLKQATGPEPAAFRLESLSLVRSQLRPDGAVYTALFVTPLGAAPGAE